MAHSTDDSNYYQDDPFMQNFDAEKYLLKLYISGITPNSARAIENIRVICEDYLKGRYDLQIIDIYQQPLFAIEEQIVAIPTLVKVFPGLQKKLVGDMSDTDKVLSGLGIKKK
jgi:circadian clock protein KaiB